MGLSGWGRGGREGTLEYSRWREHVPRARVRETVQLVGD